MHSDEDRQGSLFGGEAFGSPPPRRPFPPAPPREEAVARAPREEAVARATREELAPPRDFVAQPAPAGDAALAHDFVALPEAGDEIRVSRGAPTPLAGPTLDDVVTHAWEGLGAGVPAACPVCHGEIEPLLGGALRGHCGTCGVTLD